MTITHKLKHSVKYRGVLGTVLFLFSIPVRFLILRTPLNQRLRIWKDRRFDRQFCVDTSGSIQLNELAISHPSRQHGQRYEGTEPAVFHRMLATLEIKHEEFTFVDFGSGKGKVLLLASDYPFKQIIGVEFAPQLHDIAQRNIRDYKSRTQKCRALKSVCMDAATFSIPDGKLLAYMANPFNEEVMVKVLGNLERSLETAPRELFILYFNPQCGYLFDKAAFLNKLVDKGRSYFSVYTLKQRTYR